MYGLILKLLYFFTFGLIAYKQIGDNEQSVLSISTIICCIYIVVFFMNLVVKKKKVSFTFLENALIYLVILYVVYTLINALYINQSALIQLLIDNIPYITLVLLMIDFKRYEQLPGEIFRFMTIILSSCLALALIMFIMGYSKLEISLSSLNFIPSLDYYYMFGENRLSWLMTHKVRFAFFCLIAIMFIFYNKNSNRTLRLVFIIIGLVDMYLSNSMTTLAVTMILFIFLIDFKNVNRYIKFIVLIIGTLFLILLVKEFLDVLLEKRDLLTFGGRRYIWEAAIEFIANHPFGVITISKEYVLTTHYYGSEVFSNAHNLFLNEFMKHGIIGGVLFICIFLTIVLRILKCNKKMIGFIVALLISCMMDVIFNREMLPIFLFALPVIFYAEQFQSNNSIKK
ncbi:O-antigen ligase family protein [Bacillus toyonensis]